jgi:hypothetical protein
LLAARNLIRGSRGQRFTVASPPVSWRQVRGGGSWVVVLGATDKIPGNSFETIFIAND